MITVVSGSVGDGKSYYCVSRVIVPHLLKGGVVATNMRLSLDNIRKNFHRNVSSRQLISISADDDPRKIPRGDLRGHGSRKVIVVLDEALNWFASAEGPKDSRKLSWGEWLRQSDKLGQNVFFIAQNFERAAKWIRELAAVITNVSSLKRFRFLGVPLGKIMGLSSLSAVRDIDAKSAVALHFGFMRISSLFWSCYDTSELYGFDSASNAYDGLVVYPAARVPMIPFLVPSVFLVWGVVRVFSA